MKGNFQITFKGTSETLWSGHIRNGRVQTMYLHLSEIQCPCCLQIIDKKKKKVVKIETTNIQSGFVVAKGSVSVNSGKKRKLEEEIESLKGSAKKSKPAQIVIASEDSSSPSGLIWHHDNYSCAYDALLTIIYEVWSADRKVWTRRFKKINQHNLKSLSACFKQYMNGQASFETVRDTIRHEIHSQSPAQFFYRTRGTSVLALASTIFPLQNLVAISNPECTSCEYSEPSVDDRLEFVLYEPVNTPKSTSHWLRSLQHETHNRCPQCFSGMMQPISFKSVPNVLLFEINSKNIKVNKLWNLNRMVKQ